MTKPLDPEIKTLRAISRELAKHDEQTRQRITWFFYEQQHPSARVQIAQQP